MQRINALSQLNWQEIIQENYLVIWGQAQAEPLTLTRHLMQNRHRLKPFKVFLGISNYGTCQIEHTDKIFEMSILFQSWQLFMSIVFLEEEVQMLPI